jgi:hypothetical protein
MFRQLSFLSHNDLHRQYPLYAIEVAFCFSQTVEIIKKAKIKGYDTDSKQRSHRFGRFHGREGMAAT